MTANICPICSGEIMTYRRVLKEAEPSAVLVCQCCGARLKRNRGVHLILVLLGILVLAAASFLIVLAGRAVLAAGLAVGLILLLCGAFTVVTFWLGSTGWIPLDDPASRCARR